MERYEKIIEIEKAAEQKQADEKAKEKANADPIVDDKA